MGGLSLTELIKSISETFVCISRNKSIIYLKEKHFLLEKRLNNLSGCPAECECSSVRVLIYYFAPGPLC